MHCPAFCFKILGITEKRKSMAEYICPVCGEKLIREQNSYACLNRHNFDVAKEGYVNLASCKKGVSALSGDSKQMCLDRRDFLEQGFYEPLAKKLSEIAYNSCRDKNDAFVLDAGCGEGYYLRNVRDYLCRNNVTCTYAGIDLAKEGIKLAAKREKTAENCKISFCVAGIFDLPFADGTADVIISVFAPVADAEFYRVLKKSGILVIACPAEKHLYGLKQSVYETARENTEKIPDYDGFNLVHTERLIYEIDVKKPYISKLFGMTPYYWKSSEKTQNAVNELEELHTPCDFLIKVYEK